MEKLGLSEEFVAGHCLRPFIPEIISTGGGGITRELLQENNFKRFRMHVVSRNDDRDPRVYNPMPLRYCYPPMIQETGESSSSNNVTGDEGGKKKRKRDEKKKSKPDEKKKKIMRRPKRGDDVNDGVILLLPPPSIEEFPLLVEAIESRNASRPVFLYRKKLEASDVKADQNRLLVVGREAVMQFLREEEAVAVEQGLKICGVDEEGRWYALGLKMWASVRQIVINSGWNKLVAANKAAAGDVVELWGFRDHTNGKLGFAVVFRRC